MSLHRALLLNEVFCVCVIKKLIQELELRDLTPSQNTMNINDLLQKSFRRFSNIKNGTFIKRKQKYNHAAFSAKVLEDKVDEAGKVKVKKTRRRPNSKVKSVEYVFDTENEDSVEVVRIKPGIIGIYLCNLTYRLAYYTTEQMLKVMDKLTTRVFSSCTWAKSELGHPPNPSGLTHY